MSTFVCGSSTRSQRSPNTRLPQAPSLICMSPQSLVPFRFGLDIAPGVNSLSHFATWRASSQFQGFEQMISLMLNSTVEIGAVVVVVVGW